MGAETHKTDKLAVPLSQISKVNRPLPAGDWVTLGNPTLPAVNLPTIPLFTLLTLFTGKKYPLELLTTVTRPQQLIRCGRVGALLSLSPRLVGR